MNHRRIRRHERWSRPLLGLVIVVVAAIATIISYNADNGLPFQSLSQLTVEVPNAAELNKGDAVQIGGARVGMVLKITAVRDGARLYSRIVADIDRSARIPADSTVAIEPLSILGEKTLVITRGSSSRLLGAGAVLPLSQARPVVDLNAALSTFNASTRAGLQSSITGLADGVAGRGQDINELLSALAPMLPALQHVSQVLASAGTNLPGLIDSSEQFFSALDPVSQALPSLLSAAATTFGALASSRAALGQLLDELPSTETDVTGALNAATPALRYLHTLAVALRPGGSQLRPAVMDLDQALAAGTPALRSLVPLAPDLTGVSDDVLRSVPPDTEGVAESVEELDVTVRSVSTIDSALGPAQEDCNILGEELRNGGDVIGEGDAQGSWFTFEPILSPFLLPTGGTSSSTHVNEDPIEDARGCVAGNEPYLPGTHTGNPPAADLTTAHDVTSPPAAATARARAAGLLSAPAGARLG